MARIIGLALGVLMTATAASAAEQWTVVCEEEFPPYNYVEDGKKTGIDTEIVDVVLKQLDVTPVHEVLPWNRVIATLDQNQADLAYQLAGTPERFERYAMVGPHRVGRTVFATPADSPLTYDKLEDLKGKTIGVVQGFSYAKEFNEAGWLTKDTSATNNETLVRKLAAKRYDVIIGDFNTLSFLAARHKLTDQIRFLPKIYQEVPRYIAFPKQRADKAERFKTALEAVKARGEIDAILTRWSGKAATGAAVAPAASATRLAVAGR
jgi:polar amino acid transport system substrate-binding protein